MTMTIIEIEIRISEIERTFDNNADTLFYKSETAERLRDEIQYLDALLARLISN